MLESTPMPDSQSESAPPQNVKPETAIDSAECASGSLELQINDWRGRPIPNLPIQVRIKDRIVFNGASDDVGQIPKIENIDLGSRFEIHVKKDAGGYKRVAIGTMESEETIACLKSPKLRFEFSTYVHQGDPGQASAQKQKTIASHNQVPSNEREIFGSDKSPQVKEDRNDKGHPKVSVLEGLRDSFNRNINNGGTPSNLQTDLEHVQKLIEFGERQAQWRYDEKVTSDTYILRMDKRTFEEPASKGSDGYQNSIGRCTRYVKIALWYAGYNLPLKQGEVPKSIGAGVAPARLMGPELEKAGFSNVTRQLPDARWAAPGDVIVYQKKGAPNDAGHIDIRTYDGYLSDFWSNYLPVTRFTVIGIYRKYFDPLPDKRLRAFLKVLREWECHEQRDDAKRYFILQQAIDGNRYFTDTSKHPYEGRSGTGTFAGAYQISLGTWRDAQKTAHTPKDFSPITQDKIAVFRLQYRLLDNDPRMNALGLVRKGQIEKAVHALLKEWTSLPGGQHARKNGRYTYTIRDLMDIYERNFAAG